MIIQSQCIMHIRVKMSEAGNLCNLVIGTPFDALSEARPSSVGVVRAAEQDSEISRFSQLVMSQPASFAPVGLYLALLSVLLCS